MNAFGLHEGFPTENIDAAKIDADGFHEAQTCKYEKTKMPIAERRGTLLLMEARIGSESLSAPYSWWCFCTTFPDITRYRLPPNDKARISRRSP
jgi:hypothetical protein